MDDISVDDMRHSLPEATALRQNVQENQTKRTLFKFGLVLLILIVIITLGAVLGSKNKGKSKNNSSSSTVTGDNNMPSMEPARGRAPSAQDDHRAQKSPVPAPAGRAIEVIKSVTRNDGKELEDPTSYQSRAVQFVESDINLSTFNDKTIIQRYVLACIYYSTYKIRTRYTDFEYPNEDVPVWMDTTSWMTTDNECFWFGVTCNSNNLISEFNVHNNQLTGRFPPEIALLYESLERLDIGFNVLDNSGDDELSWIADLLKLRYLYFGSCYFQYNGIPYYLSQLTLLEELDISFTLMNGPINASIFTALSNLQYLEMGGNGYNSSLPSEIYQLPNLQTLYIENAWLSDTPEFIQYMHTLSELWIDDNPGINGTLPTGIGELSHLKSISISGCSLTGPIPTEIGQLSTMAGIWLYDNDLRGTIPTEVANLKNLQNFQTQGNSQLTGSMPPGLCVNTATFNGELLFLSTDCKGQGGNVICECCDCCKSPCKFDEVNT